MKSNVTNALTQPVLFSNIYLCFGQAVDTHTAPVSNDRKQIDIVDRIAVNIDTVTTYHQRNVCNIYCNSSVI